VPSRARVLAGLTAGLALGLSACGGDDDSGPTQLTPTSDPIEQQEFGKNTARVGGLSSADVAAAAVLSAYPETGTRPTAWFLVRKDKWREAALAAQFATRPINGAVLPIEKEFIPTATIDVVSRLKVRGFPKVKKLNTIVIGKASTDVFLDLVERKLDLTSLKLDPYALSEKLVPLHGGGAARFTSNLVIASGDQREYALPAAAWSAFSGDTLLFAGKDSVPEATRRVVAQREALRLERPTIYVIGPEKVISDAVVAQLAAYGTVKRVAGPSAVETAVALARYRDPETLFGWGFRTGPASFSLVNERDWGNAIGAWTFSAVGPQAPLLLTNSAKRLPAPVVDYLEGLAADKRSHGFVFGSRDSISSEAFAQFDRLLGTR
jgi:hypothetical protein